MSPECVGDNQENIFTISGADAGGDNNENDKDHDKTSHLDQEDGMSKNDKERGGSIF